MILQKTARPMTLFFDTVGKCSFSACKGSLMNEGIYLATVPTPVIMLQALRTARSSSKKSKVCGGGFEVRK
jgi:hypothetical protein